MQNPEIVYNFNLQKLIMCESDYTTDSLAQKFFITDFKEGALGLLFEDGDPSIALIVKHVTARSADPKGYDNGERINWWKDNFAHSVEFITDKDCYFVGFDDIEMKDIEVSSYC